MKLKIAALVIALVSAAAHAEVRDFCFVGTVTQSMPMAPAGAKVKGKFSYDTSAQPDITVGVSSRRETSSSAYVVPRSFTIQVNGHTLTAASLRVDVVSNFGGNIEDSVSVLGSPMTLDGTLFNEGMFGIFLASGPGKTRVLRNTDLPRRLVVKQFDGMNYGFVQINGSSDGTLLAFVVDRIRAANDRDED
jgi:hypothetical protein